jgi:hypothetical protein
MKGIITGVIVASLCLGGTVAMARDYDAKATQAKILLLQAPNGSTVKVIVPAKEVHKLRGTRSGDHFKLYERAGGAPLQRVDYPYQH